MKHQITKNLTIGFLAKESGVGVETVRFYERKGLIKRPLKKDSGFRQYTFEDVRKIRFVKRAQDLGFTLREIKDLLELQVSSRATCGDLRKKADLKIAEVDGKIEDLKQMKESLKKFSNCCGTKNVSLKDCGILECFESEWKC